MGSRITDLDRNIAKKLREFRIAAGLTQPQVASHLGIAYQSYQKMERGAHSFRASTLDRLASLYGKRFWDLIQNDIVDVDPMTAKAVSILGGMSLENRERAIKSLLDIKHGDKS